MFLFNLGLQHANRPDVAPIPIVARELFQQGLDFGHDQAPFVGRTPRMVRILNALQDRKRPAGFLSVNPSIDYLPTHGQTMRNFLHGLTRREPQ